MSTKKKATTGKPTMAQALALLAKLNKPALQKKYREVFGKPTRSDNVVNLRAAIARKVAADGRQAATGKKETTDASAKLAAKPRERDARLPRVGTLLERTYNDVVHKVKVLDDGFEYRGARHRSLSSLAKLITGQVWNGFLFFGLITRTQPAKGSSAEARG